MTRVAGKDDVKIAESGSHWSQVRGEACRGLGMLTRCVFMFLKTIDFVGSDGYDSVIAVAESRIHHERNSLV